MKQLRFLPLILFLAAASCQPAPPSKQADLPLPSLLAEYPGYIGDKKLYYGAAYYPEGWDLQGIEADIRRMKECHINVVRMAEFSWTLMEPEEGRFEFDWLHGIIDQLHAAGIDVILGTPTATPPGWAADKYPNMFAVNEDGIRSQHGARRNCSFTDPDYLRLCDRIVTEMAKEFGKKEGVIAWQTDNEFHLKEDYSAHSKQLWAAWLRQRYGSVDSLNRRWNLNLWSQNYSSFEMVPMPTSHTWANPSLQLAWYRFNVHNLIAFQDRQISIIRQHSDLPMTHDGMPGQTTDYERLFEHLDFVAVNNYHSFEAYDRVFSNYDRARGYGKGMHWLFETAPNNSGGGKQGRTWFLHQPDNSMHAALWMNFALGGQGSLFWLWRQHWSGHEMPHGSIISAWNKPAANYDDIVQLGANLQKSSDFLVHHPVAPAEIAMFWSHENNAMLRVEEYANGIRYYDDWTYRFYHALSDVYLHRDVINPGMDLSPYQLLFAPLMPYISDDLRQRLKTWVQSGGTLVLGPMSGYRTEEWSSYTDHALGDFGEWTGISVESRIPVGTRRRPKEIPLRMTFRGFLSPFNAQPGLEAGLWSEALSSEQGTVLATYANGMHEGLPAIIEHPVGQGKVVLLGTDPGKEVLSRLLLHYAQELGIEPLAKGDPGVLIAERRGSGSGVVVDNISTQPRTLTLTHGGGTDILSGQTVGARLTLEPFDVLVIERP